MGILQVPIFKYNEWCRTTAANHAPRGTTALIHRAPQNPTALRMRSTYSVISRWY